MWNMKYKKVIFNISNQSTKPIFSSPFPHQSKNKKKIYEKLTVKSGAIMQVVCASNPTHTISPSKKHKKSSSSL